MHFIIGRLRKESAFDEEDSDYAAIQRRKKPIYDFIRLEIAKLNDRHNGRVPHEGKAAAGDALPSAAASTLHEARVTSSKPSTRSKAHKILDGRRKLVGEAITGVPSEEKSGGPCGLSSGRTSLIAISAVVVSVMAVALHMVNIQLI